MKISEWMKMKWGTRKHEWERGGLTKARETKASEGGGEEEWVYIRGLVLIGKT